MSNAIYPCTAADPMGQGPQNGLLGEGALPWPSDIAVQAFPASIDFGGMYTAEDVDAVEFLIAQLNASENELTAQEAENYALMLYESFDKMAASGKIGANKFLDLKKKAQAIPIVGPPLFSITNLPGTLASIGGVIHAGSKTTRVESLLDLTEATKNISRNGLRHAESQAACRPVELFVAELIG